MVASTPHRFRRAAWAAAPPDRPFNKLPRPRFLNPGTPPSLKSLVLQHIGSAAESFFYVIAEFNGGGVSGAPKAGEEIQRDKELPPSLN